MYNVFTTFELISTSRISLFFYLLCVPVTFIQKSVVLGLPSSHLVNFKVEKKIPSRIKFNFKSEK